MAFSTTHIAPSTTPQITVEFSGQILLKPGGNNTCKIGVNRFDRPHVFQVLLIVNKPGRPPITIPLISGPLTAAFTIRASDQTSDQGDFLAFARDPFDRIRNDNNELDYRWGINFVEFHGPLETNEGVEPIGTLTTGVLYTPNRTDPNLNPRLIRDGSDDIQLNQIASNLAVTINLRQGQTLVFECSDLGEPVRIRLPRNPPDPDGTTYTLYFINEPASLNVTAHDEFALYYKVLKSGGDLIPQEQRFELEVDGGGRTDEIPCMPGIINP